MESQRPNGRCLRPGENTICQKLNLLIILFENTLDLLRTEINTFLFSTQERIIITDLNTAGGVKKQRYA